MNLMVERVALALRDELRKIGYGVGTINAGQLAEALAPVAIKAMREPTEVMIKSPLARCYNSGDYVDQEVRRIFSSMIDVALHDDRQSE